MSPEPSCGVDEMLEMDVSTNEGPPQPLQKVRMWLKQESETAISDMKKLAVVSACADPGQGMLTAVNEP